MTKEKKVSTSETGHVKNVANFGTAIQLLQEMGSLYNPSNTNLNLSNLLIAKQNLDQSIANLNLKIPIYKNAVANREKAIEPIGKIMTRVRNFVKSTTIPDAGKETISAQVKKIRGDIKPKKINPESSDTNSISTSQQSYDSRIANLATLIEQLNSHPQYIPNEEELKTQTLLNFQQQLVALSNDVNSAGNSLITARKERNDLMYNTSDNALKLIQDAKAYVKSLGDSAQPYYKALVKLQFRTK